jgi:hypothetical protein
MKTTLLAVGLCGMAIGVNAGINMHLVETFESGAVFSGNVTFTDSGDNLTAVDGYLTGDRYGSQHMTWIWNPSINWAGGYPYGGNFLANGTSPSDYTYFICITWDYSAAPVLTLTGNALIGYGNNVDRGDDLSVSAQLFAPVPEPSTYLAGLGALTMMGLFGWRNRK